MEDGTRPPLAILHLLSAILVFLNVAATTAPTTLPATAPATAAALDQSTPKALLKTFFVSHGDVDQGVLRSLLHAGNPIEQKLLDSAVQIEQANARLRAAEREKFGRATTGPASVPPGL